MKAEDLNWSEMNIDWSEMTDNKTFLYGVKQISLALYFMQLITYDELDICVRSGVVPDDLSSSELGEVFKGGIVLDRCEDAFAFLSMRRLFYDSTLYN